MSPLAILVRRKALRDIAEIRRWYRQIDLSLEERFRSDLEEALSRMEAHPLAYQVLHRNTRRMSLKSFPYNLYYCVQGTKLRVVAVVHNKRSPGIARARAE